MADIVGGVTLALISDWATTLTLVFGGCCSNALTLEQLTSQHPKAGSLITFAQFLLITLNGLRKFVSWSPYPHLKPRRIPLLPYLIQVALFYTVSYLNNAAFAYRIPMTVHIIFRSGGLVISMLLGWVLQRKRYTTTQVISVLMVTAGVVLTTLSASKPKAVTANHSTSSEGAAYISEHTRAYLTGIGILTLALVLSGLLGIAQDKTYATYTRPAVTSPSKNSKELHRDASALPAPWQESMFYLHFLSMPMFILSRNDLTHQLSALNASPAYRFVVPEVAQALASEYVPSLIPTKYHTSVRGSPTVLSVPIPAPYIPLILNTLTQLVCVSGVHRLTSRVSSLTVTLILVVRKAVSLLISIILFGDGLSDKSKAMMWAGAASVFVGTMLYSIASTGSKDGGHGGKPGTKNKDE
ncbi:UAA transporter [Trametopsis cervina]|nr:UAA transporter [Trametopsis cervina]